MKREISYEWRVRELMARHHYRTSKDLVEPLRERGITLSPVQIWRIVDQNPERISFQVPALRPVRAGGPEDPGALARRRDLRGLLHRRGPHPRNLYPLRQ